MASTLDPLLPSPGQQHLLVAGGSGFVGHHLMEALAAGGMNGAVLSRRPGGAGQGTAFGYDDLPQALEGFGVLINLAGENIAGQRWTKARKRSLWESRVETTRLLVGSLGNAASGPKLLIQASAVGFYGPHGSEILDETATRGSGFLAELCEAWEAEAEKARSLGVRVVMLRLGLVLARDGGAYPRMAAPIRLFLGTKLGHGNQGLSWIHIDDLMRLILEIIRKGTYEGTVNAVSPNPISNGDFTDILGEVLHRPLLPVPGFLSASALRLVFGEMAEETLLSGAFVRPGKALEAGFTFQFPDARSALRDLAGSADP